jgi:hypothetical protein
MTLRVVVRCRMNGKYDDNDAEGVCDAMSPRAFGLAQRKKVARIVTAIANSGVLPALAISSRGH